MILKLYKSDSLSEAFILAQIIESCISDVKVWGVQNKLHLNDDKTEILLTGFAPGIDLPSSLCVGHSDIPFSNAACNLGVIFDGRLALKEQVNQFCQLAYLKIRRIGSKMVMSEHYLCFEATKTLVSSLVLSRLDYCTALLAGSPQVLLDKIQRVISARLIFKVPKSARITPFLYDLHWLPISRRIQYKIALIYFHIVSRTAPPYLSEVLHLYSPRSAADTRIFRVPRMGRRILGERSFQYIGPALWNSLPLSVRHSSLLSSFRSKLKTRLFSFAY